jgi:hypothetical protein
MRQVSAAYLVAERNAVAEGRRPGALQSISPEQIPEVTRQMAVAGVVVLPLGKTARSQGYQSAHIVPSGNAPWDHRCAITRPGDVDAWVEAWKSGDNDAMGRLLGYPECCRKFFEWAWVQEKWIDTTGPMRNTGAGLNTLLRWFGVRPVSHLPCSSACAESALVAKAFELTEPEATWHREMLSWPTLWSSLHGIAEIYTPVFRASVPTDALAEKTEVCYFGTSYPAEGARGLTFPYRMNVPIVIERPSLKNGFISDETMRAAHRVLLEQINGLDFDTVLDLGCGDGTLLMQIPALRRIGVESNADVALIAAKTLTHVVTGDCTDRRIVDRLLAEWRPSLVIAQADRNPVGQFPGHCWVLTYSYENGTRASLVTPLAQAA